MLVLCFARNVTIKKLANTATISLDSQKCIVTKMDRPLLKVFQWETEKQKNESQKDDSFSSVAVPEITNLSLITN